MAILTNSSKILSYPHSTNRGVLEYGYGDDFVFTIDTSLGTGSSFTLPLRSGYNYDMEVFWDDGSKSTITAYDDADITHSYATHGVYQIKVRGTCQAWYFNNTGDKLKLVSIDNWGDVGCVRLENAFYGCTNLEAIPDTSITYPLVSTNGFFQTFRGCTGITSIPTDLFKYNTLVSASGFYGTFYGCSNLTGSIPTDLFRYNTLVSTVGFYYTFYGCSGLTGSIPTDLFRYNTLVSTYGFYYTFYNCSGLTGSIPTDLFRYNTLVSTYGFSRTFSGCSGLTGAIPADLFRYNTLVSTYGFYYTFYDCTGLTSIPEDLFYYNVNCTSYLGTFQSCRNLALPTRLFDLSALSIVTSFADFMNVTSTSYSPTGTIQDIWNYTSATSTNAFDQCTAITNYADIPTAWT